MEKLIIDYIVVSSEAERMNNKIWGLIAVGFIAVALATIFLIEPWLASPERQQTLDFTVSGTNECLRFLTKTVQTAYVPFRTGANEKWQLTINCTEMPGAGAWTDVYIYEGYWDGGSDHKCDSQDIYPIIDQIESMDFEIRTNSTFTDIFGESTPQSYTVFFIFPAGGSATFHITLNQINQNLTRAV